MMFTVHAVTLAVQQKPPHEPAPCRAWELFDEEIKSFIASGEVRGVQRLQFPVQDFGLRASGLGFGM